MISDVMIGVWTLVAVSSTYIASSLILLHWPRILHSPKRLKFKKCRHISHRGGAGERLENTVTAFRHALTQGTEMFELDVNLTADGEVVVAHDNDLERITGVNSKISDVKLKDLPLISNTIQVTFSNGKTVTCGESDDRNIPLLRTILEEFPEIPLNIDPKQDDNELIEKLVNLLREFNRIETVAVGSKSNDIMDKIHKLEPDIPLVFSAKRVFLTYVSFYVGLLPFLPIKESCLELPLPSVIFNSFPTMFGKWSGLIHCLLNSFFMRPALFRHLQRRGCHIYLWVTNEESEFDESFKDYNVDGVMTDYPTKLRTYLDRVQHQPGYKTFE